MDHLIDKYLKKPEVVKELFQKEVSISLKVDGAAFQISCENDKVTYHKRGGSSKSLGPIIDEYTQLMRKNVNDAIEYFEAKKDILKKYKFYAIEMFNDSYILLTVIDTSDNIIDDPNQLKEIAKSLDIDCVPILFNGVLNNEQVESLISMMTLAPETTNDVYKKYLTDIFGKGEYEKFLNGDEVEGIVLTWIIDDKIQQFKIINPAFKTRHDKEIKDGNEAFKKEIEELSELFEFLYDSLNEYGEYRDDNWLKNLNDNFLYMYDQEEFQLKLMKFDDKIKPKFKDFFTLQDNKVDKRIKKLIDEVGDNLKFYYEKYLSLFNKTKKRNFTISKEFQMKINALIEKLQSKNESLKTYTTRKMRNINTYITESNIISIDEKLSISDTIYKFLGNKVFGLDIKNQSEVLKMISKFMEEHSDNQVKTFTMNLKELDSKMNNCINKDDDFWYKDDMKFKEAISSRTYWNDCTLTDNTKWICFYNKENKDKFFAWVESPYFLTAKDKKGRRPLMGYPNLDINDKFSYGPQLLNIAKRVIDPEKWQKELEDQKAKEKEEEKKLAKKRIENIEKELEELKKIMDDK